MLINDPAITCQWDVSPADDDEGAMPCGAVSHFVVERSDGDESFGWDGKHESCEEHVAEVISSMVNGDDKVYAVVAIRWDCGEGTPLELRDAAPATEEG